jgi:rhodanese-related sulfurtransferase
MKSLRLATLLTLALFGLNAWSQNAPAQPKSQARELSRAEFDKLLQTPEKLLIVDVRRPDEISRIGGFPVYLAVQPADLEANLKWIPRDRQIVTVSNHATRSGRAADLLKSKGFSVLGTVGAQTYEESGGKLSKVAIPPSRQNQSADTNKKS